MRRLRKQRCTIRLTSACPLSLSDALGRRAAQLGISRSQYLTALIRSQEVPIPPGLQGAIVRSPPTGDDREGERNSQQEPGKPAR